MSIVDKIYQENINITEEKLLEKIIDINELSALDFWLLPQTFLTNGEKNMTILEF